MELTQQPQKTFWQKNMGWIIGVSVTVIILAIVLGTLDGLGIFNKKTTKSPTISPTMSPTQSPTNNPTMSPTRSPTKSPTNNPTVSPTQSPTKSPTNNPTMSPTRSPTKSPTNNPTMSPTRSPITPGPTVNPEVSCNYRNTNYCNFYWNITFNKYSTNNYVYNNSGNLELVTRNSDNGNSSEIRWSVQGLTNGNIHFISLSNGDKMYFTLDGFIPKADGTTDNNIIDEFKLIEVEGNNNNRIAYIQAFPNPNCKNDDCNDIRNGEYYILYNNGEISLGNSTENAVISFKQIPI